MDWLDYTKFRIELNSYQKLNNQLTFIGNLSEGVPKVIINFYLDQVRKQSKIEDCYNPKGDIILEFRTFLLDKKPIQSYLPAVNQNYQQKSNNLKPIHTSTTIQRNTTQLSKNTTQLSKKQHFETKTQSEMVPQQQLIMVPQQQLFHQEQPKNYSIKQKRLQKNINTEKPSFQTKNSPDKSDNKKPHTLTYLSNILRPTHHSHQLILVYLMHKEQKLSLFLNKGVQFEELMRKMYKEIYIYEKETYSISNAILKNLLYKITGFQSIDNDLLYDYQLKYERGRLDKQKFFTPFKQEDLKMPFKIHCKIEDNVYGGGQFLVRNYSDGEWAVLTSIKKSIMEQQKVNAIRKSLKSNFNAANILLKTSQSTFSQINWFQSKHHIFIVSQFIPENLYENLQKNIYDKTEKMQIFKFLVKWIANAFKIMVQSNVPIFKKICLKTIGLNPNDGIPRLSIIENVSNCLEFFERCRSVIQNGRRVSEKIVDKFYQNSFLNLLKALKQMLGQDIQSFYVNIVQIVAKDGFVFEDILKLELFNQMNTSYSTLKKHRNPLKVDFDSRMQRIATNMHNVKCSTAFILEGKNSTIVISNLRQQIQRMFSMQNMRRNQKRNQKNTILQIISTSMSFQDISKQNIGNVTQYKKQQARKSQIKTNQKSYIQQIINELNQNENFIKTTKQNNLASIQSYLNKSDQRIKVKMITRIQNKNQNRLNTTTGYDVQSCRGMDKNIQQQDFHSQNDKKDDKSLKGQLKSPDKHESFFQNSYFVHTSQEQNRKDQCKKSALKKAYSTATMTAQKQNNDLKRSQRLVQLKTETPKLFSSLAKKDSLDPVSTTMHQKIGKLQELFVNCREYPKQQKLILKKKQYGIYLEEGQKQYSKIKMYRKNTVNQGK